MPADVVARPDDPEPPGSWLRRRRAAAGLTQEELAERSGVTARTIGNLERGRTVRPYPDSVRRMARALGLSEADTGELISRYRDQTGPARSRPLGRGRGGRAGAAPPERAQGETGTVRVPVPRQLPAAIRNFVGREAELEVLAGLARDGQADRGQADRGIPIALITGMAGVGKTALAVHWAHQAAGLFPDGQLYVNLHGFDPSGEPLPAIMALRGALGALGLPAGQLPQDQDSVAGLYRSLLSGRRMLVVLDNARNAGQVRPLLPGGPDCMVLVTSRSQLRGLVAAQNACPVTLGLLTSAQAGELLTARLGPQRLAAESAAAAEVIGLCAGLPLALAVTAARVSARPDRRLSTLARELTDAQARLDAVDAGDAAVNVRAVFSWSVSGLPAAAARMFALLGLHPGPDITVPAAASLAALPRGQALQALDTLADAHLVTEHLPGRYALHDLLRAYAAEQVAPGGENARREAIRRVLGHYLHTARAASLLLRRAGYTVREPTTLAPPQPGVTPEHLADHHQAQTWFLDEYQVLVAAIALAARAGFDAYVWQLPPAMGGILDSFPDSQGRWREQAALNQTALAAATRKGSLAEQASAHRGIASAQSRLGDYEQARCHLTECLRLYQQLADSGGQASVHRLLIWIAERQSRYADALSHGEQALSLYRALGDQAGQADALNSVGWCHALLGHFEQARVLCRQALAVHRSLGARYFEACTWDSLGYAAHKLGDFTEAISCYQQALGIFSEHGARSYHAGTLTRLGDAHFDARSTRQARQAWQQALSILSDLHHPDADLVRAKLDQPLAEQDAGGATG